MKRKLIITTLGIASLGINSVLVESVHSQIIENNQVFYCYLEIDDRRVGHISVSDRNLAISTCNQEILECRSDPYGCYAQLANPYLFNTNIN